MRVSLRNLVRIFVVKFPLVSKKTCWPPSKRAWRLKVCCIRVRVLLFCALLLWIWDILIYCLWQLWSYFHLMVHQWPFEGLILDEVFLPLFPWVCWRYLVHVHYPRLPVWIWSLYAIWSMWPDEITVFSPDFIPGKIADFLSREFPEGNPSSMLLFLFLTMA